MEKQNTMYYHCPRCGEWVPGTRYRCRCGQNLFGLPLEILPDESNQTECRTEENAPKRVCTDCGNAYFTYERNCPDCGGLLTIAPEKEPPRPVHTLSPAPASDEEEYSDHIDTDMIFEEEESEQTETPLYFFNATRYENGGVPVNSMYMNIPIEDGMVMGRNLFLTDNRLFFPMPTKKLDEHYRNISTYNVQLNVREGNLFVRYCPSKPGKMKVRIYVNEKPLEDGKEERLYPGDLLRFGGSKRSDRVIDIRIAAAGAVWREAGERQALDKEMREHMETVQKSLQDINQLVQDYGEESRQGFGRMDTEFGNLKEELHRIGEIIERIKPSDLKRREGQSAEEYEKHLEELIPQATPGEMKLVIEQFLRPLRKKRGEAKYKELLDFFNDNPVRQRGIFRVGIYEEACPKKGMENDYTGPMSLLGRTMESFVMGEVAYMVRTVDPKGYQQAEDEAKKKGNRLSQGTVLWLLKNNKYRILDYADSNNEDMEKCFGKALGALHNVRKARNEADHGEADTEEELKEITKAHYENVKNNLLNSGAIETLHGLYGRVKERG